MFAVPLARGNVRDAAPRTASAPEPSEEQALPRPRTLLPCVAGAPAPLQSRDDRTATRTLDDQLAWPVPDTQRRRPTQRHRDDHRSPGATRAPGRRCALENKPRRIANSI